MSVTVFATTNRSSLRPAISASTLYSKHWLSSENNIQALPGTVHRQKNSTAIPRSTTQEHTDHEGATHYYDNESDNFWQRHYQLYYAHTLNDRWTLNAAADITRGDGYYEQYFAGGKNSFNYSITDTGDCIARMEMKNTSYAGRLSAQFDQHPINLTFGTMALYYDGDNFGNVVWSQSGIRRDRWYDNQGKKATSPPLSEPNTPPHNRSISTATYSYAM